MVRWIQRFRTWAGASKSQDADSSSEQVAFVRPFEAPAIVELLRTNGIACTVIDGLNHATWEPMNAILVDVVDAPRSVEIIGRLRGYTSSE